MKCCHRLCMAQRMVLMPGGEILVPQNDGQRIVQTLPPVQEEPAGCAWLERLRPAGELANRQPVRVTSAISLVADADNDGSPELVMAVKFKHKGLIDDARSAIVTYELN